MDLDLNPKARNKLESELISRNHTRGMCGTDARSVFQIVKNEKISASPKEFGKFVDHKKNKRKKGKKK